ncbi:adenosylcobinamide-GDP ribazoletransferase [Corynebacterium mendelii]|uniref:Adenosylcobinamide-GDP ribazoletransferase n=1 Tax=Corynebacterium mendelii TaxID=2765362 RepID=A0A939IWI3_9CORY|nr:adenosylcobinamide-GDP ribazoletransferase [Corynebacterium mendelii]MBN9643058.1 adenosylcobinamide-GDP ribazoletransferase [Corynebacterium mendelii]
MSGKGGPTRPDDNDFDDTAGETAAETTDHHDSAGTRRTGDGDAEPDFPDVGNETFSDRPHWFAEGLSTILSWVTIIPISTMRDEFDRTSGRRAMAFLPFVGIMLSVLTFVVAGLGAWLAFPGLLTAILVVALWAIVTRMMHLDGLADVGDALGSYGNPEKARAIVADSSTGALGMGFSAIVVGLQVAAIHALLTYGVPGVGMALVAMIPVAARIGGMVCATRPFRPFSATNFGALLIGTIPKRWVGFWVVAAIVIYTFLVAGSLPLNFGDMLFVGYPGGTEWAQWIIAAPGIALLVTVAVAFVWAARLSRRFGGLNGDCIGCTVEISAAVSALVMTLVIYAAPLVLPVAGY